VGSLERFDDGSVVDFDALWKEGLIRNLNNPVKVLNNGTLTKKLRVMLHACTAAAREAITNAGGTFEEI
jgi:large subunit ribosomal protein L15